MLQVTSKVAGTRVRLVCAICRQPLPLEAVWLGFASDQEEAEGKFLHRACLQGNVVTLFGASAVTLLAGLEAFKRLAEDFETRRQLDVI